MTKSISKILLTLIIVIIIVLFLKGLFYKKEIDENKNLTVGKFTYCKEFPKTSVSFFKYYADGVLYEGSYGQCPKGYEDKLNRYYTLYYSSKDPKKFEVDFSKPITSKKEILKAGFNDY